jgi:hypothetical protein
MADFSIGSQRADRIQNAETILNFGPPAVDHRAAAEAALAGREYEAAVQHLKQALDQHPGDSLVRFRLVLAALRGRHPDRYGARQVQALIERLVRLVSDAPDCHHARVLALVINEGMLTRGSARPQRLAPESSRLVALVDQERGREILTHVPVPDSPVWSCLNRRLRHSTAEES